MTISQIIFIKNKISRGNFDLLDLEKPRSPTCRINAFKYTNIGNNDKKKMLAIYTTFMSIKLNY